MKLLGTRPLCSVVAMPYAVTVRVAKEERTFHNPP